MNKTNSPYLAITGCSFQYYEFQRLLPLLMDADADTLLKDEIENNQFLMVNSLTSRKRFVAEFKRRYRAVPAEFWLFWQRLSEAGHRAGLLYAILKTYKLVFDFHFNLTLKRWNSIDHHLLKDDLLMEFNELSARDAYVDSWSESTKEKCSSAYLTILRQAGMLNEKSNELTPIKLSAHEYEYYIRTGEEWFLEACLLYPYEIKAIKEEL